MEIAFLYKISYSKSAKYVIGFPATIAFYRLTPGPTLSNLVPKFQSYFHNIMVRNFVGLQLYVSVYRAIRCGTEYRALELLSGLSFTSRTAARHIVKVISRTVTARNQSLKMKTSRMSLFLPHVVKTDNLRKE